MSKRDAILHLMQQMNQHGRATYRGYLIRDSGWGCYEIPDLEEMSVDTIPDAVAIIDRAEP